MEEGILNYSPTVMFRGTPCIYIIFKYLGHKMSSSNYEFVPLYYLITLLTAGITWIKGIRIYANLKQIKHDQEIKIDKTPHTKVPISELETGYPLSRSLNLHIHWGAWTVLNLFSLILSFRISLISSDQQ